MAKTTLAVPDISCEHCERTIREALGPVEGVRAVAVDIPLKEVRIDYDEGAVTVGRLIEILEAEDYPASAT